MKYRKKPVVIEAVQFCGWPGSQDTCIMAHGAVLRRKDREDGAVIDTLEGPHLVSVGDWIIKGVAGEFYPCKPSIFQATYEPA